MITKEKWKEVETHLRDDYALVTFKLNDHKIDVARARVGEGRTELCVFVDGKIKSSWTESDDPMRPIVAQVWNKKSKAMYTSNELREMEKTMGKRILKKRYPQVYSRHEYHTPTFKTAASLVRNYKKIEGLELLTIGGAAYD